MRSIASSPVSSGSGFAIADEDRILDFPIINTAPRVDSMANQLTTRIAAFAATLLTFAISGPAGGSAAAEVSFPVAVRVDAAQSKGELRPFWRFFGADEPNYAYMKDGKKLLAELGELRPGEVFFRAHNLLCSGDGTPALKWGSSGAYAEDADGDPQYDWTIVDRIFSTYLDRGVRPYVQIGFMPKELSIQPEPYQHDWTPRARYEEIYTGWAYPPNDWDKWQELVYQWASHCRDHYGAEEVDRWYWQVWNEANAPYWQGTPEEFQKLHDYAIAAVRRAIPTARVGGPDTAGHGGDWMVDFLEHCLRGKNYATGEIGTPLDFVSFHAKGRPEHLPAKEGVPAHVRMGINAQLRTVDEGFRIIASFPELAGTPVVIGESDPEGCAACQGPQLAYRNTTMYSSYTAASFARKHDLADRHDVNLEGVLTWAFEFEGQPYFAGFRSLATNGIDKPVLNVFRMFARMSGDRLAVDSDGAVPLDAIVTRGVRGKPDVSALASLDDGKLSVLVWHYHDDDLPGPDAAVTLELANLPADAKSLKIRQFLIDREHSNAYTVWQKMGSPQQPTAEQYAELEQSAQLAEIDAPSIDSADGSPDALQITLPRQGVTLLELTWDS
jgi:xylan 1,4-beta-xylosidase